jgi:hypothetical protein
VATLASPAAFDIDAFFSCSLVCFSDDSVSEVTAASRSAAIVAALSYGEPAGDFADAALIITGFSV